MRRTVNFILMICCLSISNAQSGNSTCNTGSQAIVQPFVGEWEESDLKDGSEVFIGRLSTKLNLDDCVLTQRFISADSTFKYQSQGFVNPATQLWEETYVFNSGRYSKYLWIVDGDVLYTLRIGGSRHIDNQHGLKYIDIRKDQFTVVQEESIDGGVTWVKRDTTRIKRLH
ncbi:MAG: hypothetical protein OEQ81_08315 [Flavobacteriaceae bacterium]|nr:hypothetical protein [Flavobacteriaceae bacterium]